MEIRFLSSAEVFELHRMQIERYGGAEGLRDRGLLDSALAQPEAAFGGEFLHTDVFEMAAAYLYHLAMNHPFIDGNKRVGLHAAYTFLSLNGWQLSTSPDDLYELVIAVTEGRADKTAIADAFRVASKPRD